MGDDEREVDDLVKWLLSGQPPGRPVARELSLARRAAEAILQRDKEIDTLRDQCDLRSTPHTPKEART